MPKRWLPHLAGSLNSTSVAKNGGENNWLKLIYKMLKDEACIDQKAYINYLPLDHKKTRTCICLCNPLTLIASYITSFFSSQGVGTEWSCLTSDTVNSRYPSRHNYCILVKLDWSSSGVTRLFVTCCIAFLYRWCCNPFLQMVVLYYIKKYINPYPKYLCSNYGRWVSDSQIKSFIIVGSMRRLWYWL